MELRSLMPKALGRRGLELASRKRLRLSMKVDLLRCCESSERAESSRSPSALLLEARVKLSGPCRLLSELRLPERPAVSGLDGRVWAPSLPTRLCPLRGRSKSDVLRRPPSDAVGPELREITE